MVENKVIKKKRQKKNIVSGLAFINATFNNTMITITDEQVNKYISKNSNEFTILANAYIQKIKSEEERYLRLFAEFENYKNVEEFGMIWKD